MPVLTLERHVPKRRPRPRWPHQRLAAGLAQQRMTDRFQQGLMGATGRRSSQRPSTGMLVCSAPSSPTVSVSDLDQRNPSPGCLSAGDLAIGENDTGVDSAFDESMHQGLVALPVSHSKTSRKAPSDTADQASTSQAAPQDEGDTNEHEEQFNLRYYKKPLFNWF
ncbi:unnamed protein product [Echinostoma caproni]|uniref:Uncharacterized protein n=1 Tax=Echinostoma caproni TaxID=27848 RepID=A0A183ACJ4_9TREM|nr:unnamed protein product [Echinostoma caproni]